MTVRARFLGCCLFALGGLSLAAPGNGAVALDAVDRLAPERLQAVHQAVATLQAAVQPPQRRGPLRQCRVNLHVHSAFSHDSRGKLAEIVAAARKVGTDVLMFNEHPADHYDFFQDGHQGTVDGVLLVPGAETRGLLVFPRHSVRGAPSGGVQEFSDLVRSGGGLTFVSHLEERLDWQLQRVTGVEIYNTHADFKDEKRLLVSLANPVWLLGAADLFRRYPQEAFSALQDYPEMYLRRWDELSAIAHHTGVSANDSHQNSGVAVKVAAGNRLRIEDALGKKLLEVDAGLLAAALPVPAGAKVGDAVFQMQLDPYEVSLRHVGTHLLVPDVTRESVWQALEEGRAFVAFDWIADSAGFDVAALAAGMRYELGSHLQWEKDLQLECRAPLAGHWKLIRNGQVHRESDGASWDVPITEAGRYRLELWLDVAGEAKIWILTNPIYVIDPAD